MGHLLKLNCAQSPLNLRILSSTCVPLTLTTVQVLNLALTHKKRITVQGLGVMVYRIKPMEGLSLILCPDIFIHAQRMV
jgi:hypothetical protein